MAALVLVKKTRVMLISKRFLTEINEHEKSFIGLDKLNIKRSILPAITHIDYSARIQTVHETTNPLFYKLISYFKKDTGCPVILNTSFNIRDEPIVCTPEEAFYCFMSTKIDILICGNSLLYKNKQFNNLPEINSK